MKFTISAVEARILGCLVEKEATTPDGYPLTLNSLVTACNQKSNRDPVMDLDSDEVLAALDELIDKTLVSTWKSDRNRMAKYQHKLRHRVFDEFNFSLPEVAVLAVLFLRGPQTLGEIRSRCARIHTFGHMDEVAGVLSDLEQNPDGPYVTLLPRLEGRKEPRYMHLFCGEPDPAALAESAGNSAAPGSSARESELEQQVEALENRLNALEDRFAAFVEQFE